jgi:hypothetical protein
VVLTIARVEQFRNLIPPYCVQNPDGGFTCDGNANCPAVVALYDQIAAPYPPPGSGPTELPAYNLYHSGVVSFVETQGGWVSSCREALGTGATVTIGGEQRNTLVLFLQQGLDLLYQAKQLLETGA